MGAEYSDEFFAGEFVPKETYEKSPKPTKPAEAKEESVEAVEALEEQIEAVIDAVRAVDGKNYTSEFFDQYYRMLRDRVEKLNTEMKNMGYQVNKPHFRNIHIESETRVEGRKGSLQLAFPQNKNEKFFLVISCL